jgi:hypothetical protein
VDATTFNTFTSIAGSEITVDVQHIDFEEHKIYTLDKLEKMVISSQAPAIPQQWPDTEAAVGAA